jgi:hypothetical protein
MFEILGALGIIIAMIAGIALAIRVLALLSDLFFGLIILLVICLAAWGIWTFLEQLFNLQ